MNPDTNQFEVLKSLEDKEALIKKFYPDAGAEDTPIFQVNERLTIRGYIFEVSDITENKIVLTPCRPADK